MYSETLIFENGQQHKHYECMAATATWEEHVADREKKRIFMKLSPQFDKYVLTGTLQHSAFYENEQTPHSAAFLFLKPLKDLFLTPLQLTVALMYWAGLSLEEVMSALGLKEDWLKKLNKQILKKTSVKEMKNFSRKGEYPL